MHNFTPISEGMWERNLPETGRRALHGEDHIDGNSRIQPVQDGKYKAGKIQQSTRSSRARGI